MLVPLGKSIFQIPLLTKNGAGALVNADSLPTVLNVQKNGVDADESNVTIKTAKDDTPADIAGKYLVEVDLGTEGLNATENDQFIVTVNAIIAGTTLSQTYTFIVASMSGAAPTIELG